MGVPEIPVEEQVETCDEEKKRNEKRRKVRGSKVSFDV